MRDKKTSIGIYRHGGVGDTIQLTALIKAIKMNYSPCHTTVFVRKDCMTILRNNDNADLVMEAVSWKEDVEKKSRYFEIFFDCRYITKITFNNPFFKHEVPKFPAFDKLFEYFTYSNRYLIYLGVNTFNLMFLSTGLMATADDMFITQEHYEMPGIEDKKFVCLHTDSVNAPVKSWFSDYWEELSTWLLKKWSVVLVGRKQQYDIPCSLDLRSKTDIHQTANILSRATMLICPESGLAHVARAVGTQSVVLFGPTSPSLFGYPENINIQIGTCRDCFGASSLWMPSCMKFPYAYCMRELTPEIVMSYLKVILDGDYSKPEIKQGESVIKSNGRTLYI